MSAWVRSSACAGNGDCLEARGSADPELGLVHLRRVVAGEPWDLMVLERGEFAAFLTGAKAGEFDHLTGGAA